MTDIQFAKGAVHDSAGPITSFVPLTERGRDWMASEWGADLSSGAAIIETEHADLVISCAENAGLVVKAA